ncbi:MAG: ribosome-recycling factor [Candidatus Liptonbacteria bacterium]|nr:ribosome-recycling factor [Candidatus Liptonbacteria bacterium]
MEPLKEIEQLIKDILIWLKEEFSKIRSNRPSSKFIEHIKVNYTDGVYSINQLASIGVVPPREIIVSPWDTSLVSIISKAIESSGLGLKATPEGNIIRVHLPSLTEERIKELTKLIKSLAEEARIKMRLARDKVVKKINESPEDQKFKFKNNLQKMVDKFNDEIDTIVELKIKELNE